MFDDLDPPSNKKEQIIGQPLDDFSVAELKDYIADLESEIARARADIERKESSAAAADSVFKI